MTAPYLNGPGPHVSPSQDPRQLAVPGRSRGKALGVIALQKTKNPSERGYIARGLLMNAAPLTVVGLVVLLILLIYGFFYLISLF